MPAAARNKPEQDRAISPQAEPRRWRPRTLQFSLETLILVTTLVAACLGIIVAAPVVAPPLVAVIMLALVRTFAECRRVLRSGRTLHVHDKLYSYLRSLAFTALALLSAGVNLLILSIVALMIVSAVQFLVETFGGPSVAAWVAGILSLVFAIAALASAATMFRWWYWTTMVTEPSHASRSQ
jgi:hypothetical protein